MKPIETNTSGPSGPTQTTYNGQSEVDLGYAYYPDGSLETETIPGSETFAFSYDAGGRPTQLVNPNSETTTWSYQHNDLLSAQNDNNGNYVHYIQNALGQLTEIANYNSGGSVVSEVYSIAHDAPGNVTDEHISVPGYTSLGGEITNGYDSLDQIATSVSTRTATGMGYSWSPASSGFQADAAGNLTTLRGSGQSFTATNNEINATGFVYDSNGNPATYETHTVKWDEENRMTEYDGSATLTCGWRPDGMRAWKHSGSTTTYFYYDLRGVPVLEEQSGSITAINTFGPNGLISRGTSPTNEVYYQFDERGNTVTRSNASGAVLGYHGSDTYGIQFAYDPTDGSDPYLGFGAQWGYYRDSEIVFLLLGHRIYDPGHGRFLNRDPIGYAGGVNPYAYAGSNPVSGIDPSGLEKILILLGKVDGWYDLGVQNMILGRVEKIAQSQGVDYEVEDPQGMNYLISELKSVDGLVYIGHGSSDDPPFHGIPMPLVTDDADTTMMLDDNFLQLLRKARCGRPLDFVWLLSCYSGSVAKDWLSVANFVYSYSGGVSQFTQFFPGTSHKPGAKAAGNWRNGHFF